MNETDVGLAGVAYRAAKAAADSASADGFDAGYAQAIKDVVADLRGDAAMRLTHDAQNCAITLADRIEHRFSGEEGS